MSSATDGFRNGVLIWSLIAFVFDYLAWSEKDDKDAF
jgi:hypothetical protein